MRIFQTLYAHFGERHWWPGGSPFEVVVGAVLTQNTNWKNVEKAIGNLKRERMLDAGKIAKCDLRKLQKLVRPSGYYRQKARRLREVARWFVMGRWKWMETGLLREELLSIKGIGEETADSMLLYAFGRPVFVIDAYTRRFCKRHGLVEAKDYEAYREFFERNIPNEAALFNELHAQLVELGKNYCRKAKPLCSKCPLRYDLAGGRPVR